jgi:N-acetylglucosamine-6-phosphate deacetylase
MSQTPSSGASVIDVKAAFDGWRIISGRVALRDGRVIATGVQPPGERYIAAPGLIDLQVNGFGGVDFLSASVDDLLMVSRGLLAYGVTAFQPTLISTPERQLLRALETIGEASQLSGGARILPAHLEGPFLSAKWPGAHDIRHLRTPDNALLDRLLDAGPVGYTTIAPELPGGIDLVTQLRDRQITVAIGHTDATFTEASAAFEAGARALTHVFNAHRPLMAREPGPAGAALLRDDVFVEVIADGVHLADGVIMLVDRCARERVILVTDSIVAAGMGDGSFQFGPLEVTLANGRATLPDGRLAGSVATLDACLRHLVALSIPPEQALRAVTSRPAELIGRDDLGHLRPGDRADLVVFDERFIPVSTYLDGRLLWQAKVPSCA